LRKRKLKRKPFWRLLTLFFVIAVLFVCVNFGKGVYKIWRLSQIKHSEEKKMRNGLEEKQRLEHEIERLTTDSLYIEEIAREEYGMIKKGEEVYHISLPDTTAQEKDSGKRDKK